MSPEDLRRLVAIWVAKGVISPEQGDNILAAESVPATTKTPARTAVPASLVTEALAYVGGVILLAAVGWLTAEYWSSFSDGLHLAFAGGTAALLLMGGAAVPLRGGEAADRLRSVLWLLSIGAFVGLAVLLASQQFKWAEDAVALFTSTSALTYATLLWWRHRAPLQHVAVFASLAATAAALTAQLPHGPEVLPGAAGGGAGLAWLFLACGGFFTHARLGMTIGGVTAVLGAMTTSEYTWGSILIAATLALLVITAVLARSLALLAVAAIGALLATPQIMSRYFADSIAAPLVLVTVGLVMVAGALYMARSKQRVLATATRSLPVAARTAGTTGAALVVVAFAGAILVVGL